MTEIWKAIPGHEGAYEVSDQGRVRSLHRKIPVVSRKGKPYLKTVPGRILRPNLHPRGYHYVTLGKRSKRKVHALVLIAFVGPCPPDNESCHNDGDPANNMLGNLRWDTHHNNVRDTMLSGSYFSEKRKAHLKKFAELGRQRLKELHRLSGGRRIYGN
jgi:hypothetical protein